MTRYLLRRLLWVLPTLLLISWITFALLSLTPGRSATGVEGDASPRALRLAHERLEKELGLRDERTNELRPLWTRYGIWLTRAVRLEFAERGEDAAAFRARVARALRVTLLLNALAFALALALALPIGVRLGLRAGSRVERVVSLALLAVYALPAFLVATLLVLSVGHLLPVQGLVRTEHSDASLWRRALDLSAHLALPVGVLAVGPCVLVARFLRDSVARAARSETVQALRGFGARARDVRWCTLRLGLAPVTTLVGSFVPLAVTGSVVVESIFQIEGMGLLAWSAFAGRDQAMVMALTLITALATLLGLIVSDLLHAAVDPRVRLR